MSTRTKVMLAICYVLLLANSIVWSSIASNRLREINTLKWQLNNAQKDRRACRGTHYL